MSLILPLFIGLIYLKREEQERKKENKNQTAMILAREKGRETGDDRLATIGNKRTNESTVLLIILY